jgi:hypothetical protein
MSRSEEIKKIIALCDYAVSSEDMRAEWSLDFAVFGFALSRLDEYMKEDRYFIFLKSFCDRFVAERPILGSLSASAPVLIVLEMYKRTKNDAYLSLTASVMEAVKKMPSVRGFEKRTSAAAGHGGEMPKGQEFVEKMSAADRGEEKPEDRKFGEKNSATCQESGDGMPKDRGFGEKNFAAGQEGLSSVKTADIVTFLLTDYMFLKYTADIDELDALVKQPKKYAASLMDKRDNLFHRSFFRGRIFKNTKIHFPLGRNYPARENVLALFALTLVAEGEDYIHKEINETIARLTTAINNYRNVDGSYNAFFKNKRKSQSVGFLTNRAVADGGADRVSPFGAQNFDPSVASYYAACCLKNAAAGIIDAGYAETGKNAYMTAADSLVKESGAIYMPNNSKKSFVKGFLSMFSRASGVNNLFGIAGIIFAALEYEKI